MASILHFHFSDDVHVEDGFVAIKLAIAVKHCLMLVVSPLHRSVFNKIYMVPRAT